MFLSLSHMTLRWRAGHSSKAQASLSEQWMAMDMKFAKHEPFPSRLLSVCMLIASGDRLCRTCHFHKPIFSRVISDLPLT